MWKSYSKHYFRKTTKVWFFIWYCLNNVKHRPKFGINFLLIGYLKYVRWTSKSLKPLFWTILKYEIEVFHIILLIPIYFNILYSCTNFISHNIHDFLDMWWNFRLANSIRNVLLICTRHNEILVLVEIILSNVSV